MASFTMDPQQRMEREQRRIERKMDIRNYMPGYSNRRPSIPKRRSGEFDYELDDETRQGLLRTLGEGTLGALYRFGNVLDLPGSSIRDVASTVTGEPRNPFDQWLSPTTHENRIWGRELNRQWGLAGQQDTWGNLAGGIGTEILLDPLTWWGFGATHAVKGAGALTKHGQLLQKSGLLKKMPKYMAEKGIERARDATSALATMGPREAMQQVRHGEDIISKLPTDAARRQAREALEATAESVGYKKTADIAPETLLERAGQEGSAYGAFLQKEGREALAGSSRFGMPNWRIFGASPKKQLRQSPHVLLGKPGSKKLIKRAAKWDERFRKASEWPLMQHLKSLMHPKYGSFVGEIAQRMAPAFKEGEKAAAHTAMRESTDIVNNFKWAFGKEWEHLSKKLSPTERVRTHDLIRGMMENARGMNHNQAAVVHRATQLLGEKIGYAKDLGVNIDVLDDDFIEFFPRQLSAAVKDGSFDELQKMGPRAAQGLPNNVFTIHEIARLGPLRDIKGGESTINELFIDPAVRQIKNSEHLNEAQKERQLLQFIDRKYKNRIPKTYRGQQINRPDLSGLSNTRQAEIRDMVAAVQQQDFSDIMSDSIPWPIQKAKIDRQLRDINIRTDTNWIRDEAIPPSSIYDPNTRLWEVKGNRHKVLANMLLNVPDEVHNVGLFGNFPLYDLEKYFQQLEDTINRADFTMSILRHPKALFASARGSKQGRKLRDVLEDLSFNADHAVERLAWDHGVDFGPNLKTKQAALERFGGLSITREVEDDLFRYKKLFESPEPANYFANILDSLNQVFKTNVTSPWPAFHLRNIATGQFRNHVAGMFSLRTVKEARDFMRGKPIKAAELPAVQRRWESLQRDFPNLRGMDLAKNNDKANDILRGLARENNLMGPYALLPGYHATTESRMMGGGEGGQTVGEGSAQYFKTTMPGTDPISFRHAAESYMGLPHKMKVVDEQGNITKELTPATTTSPLIGITPFPVWDMPLWLWRKGWGKTNRRLGRTTERVERWADEPFLRSPNEWKVRDARESLGGKGRTARKFQDIEGERLYGPPKGGEEVGYYAEGLNRLSPWLHRLREGADPAVAAREVIDAQIDYSARNFTAFERQVLKRGVPFYSFTSRSLPWAIRKFYEEPHNMLSQVIRGTKRTGEHIQKQHEGGVEGPVPSYIRDTLAIPMKSRVPGVKRFFTGTDLMSQDLWQLLMPLMAGKPEQAMFEAAGRSNPLLIKYPIETLTGTSLWQRGVEGGRPLRTMSPPVGRALTNVGEAWEKATGNQFEKGWKEDLLNKFGPTERFAAVSPYSRALSSTRKLFDVRKSAADKALSLGFGAGITDISPRQQEAMLREYLRGMISDRGGYVFQKATFPKSTLREMSPEDQLEAMKLKALNDERAKIAKEMKEKARLGVPGY